MNRSKNTQEFREKIAESFAHVLEEEGLSWKKGWSGNYITNPRNGITNACYKGCNRFHLALLSMANGYTDPRWVTMVQIMDKDGKYHPNEKWHLQAGSKATYVEYWMPVERPTEEGQKGKPVSWEQFREAIRNGRDPEEFYLTARYTAVFHASMVDGMPELKTEQKQTIEGSELIEKLSENMNVPIYHDGEGQAYYSPKTDDIHLPDKQSFKSEYEYNATALHELSHSSGAEHRLNRKLLNFFGTPEYAYEELVAEMSSCFMSANIQTEISEEHIRNHKAYVQSWIQEIRNQPEMLMRAIKDAEQAANYMDFMAELITEEQYERQRGQSMTVSETAVTPEETPTEEPVMSL